MPRRPVFPISLDVNDRKVVVVGDDDRAADRRRRLTDAGARVVRIPEDEYEPGVCQGACLVMAHTGNASLDRRIAIAARAAGALAYAHDQPEISDFSMPALVRRGPLTIAIATDAVAPVLARRLRVLIEALLATAGPHLDTLIETLEARRRALPPGQRGALATIAARLRLRGSLEIDDE